MQADQTCGGSAFVSAMETSLACPLRHLTMLQAWPGLKQEGTWLPVLDYLLPACRCVEKKRPQKQRIGSSELGVQQSQLSLYHLLCSELLSHRTESREGKVLSP